MFKKVQDHPEQVGALLSYEEKQKLVKFMYRRYIYSYGLTPSLEDNPQAKRNIEVTFDKFLDCLDLNGYIVVKRSSVGE